MSIKLYFYALTVVFALSSSVMAAPPPVQPAPTPDQMSHWLPLRDYPYPDSLKHTWFRVERTPLAAEGMDRNLDDVITFDVESTSNPPVPRTSVTVRRSTLMRKIEAKATHPDSKQCEANRGIPLMRNFQSADEDSVILHGTWAATEYFSPDGKLLSPSETPIIKIQSRGGKVEVRHLPLAEKQNDFNMARTCDEKKLGLPGAFVNRLLFKAPYQLVRVQTASGSRQLVAPPAPGVSSR